MDPVIIEVAINGITSAERNPHTPRQPADIAAESLRCIEGGAAIIHNHIDDLHTTGLRAAARYAEGWQDVLAAYPDAILCPTATIAPTMEERLAHYAPCARRGARMAPVDMGSLNIADTADDGAPGAMRFQNLNDFNLLDSLLACLDSVGLGPSIAIYEPGFLRATLAYQRAGKLPAGSQIKLYFGGDYDLLGTRPHREQKERAVSFGLPPTRAALEAYLDMLGDNPLPWAVAVLGGDMVNSEVCALALERGGHLRIGLEDYGGPGQPTNMELLEAAVAACNAAGRRPATPAEAAAILGLPGR